MDVGDPVVAEKILRTYGYHRLSSYSYVFRTMLPEEQRDPRARRFRDIFFVPGTSLEAVARLYEFDAKLREVLLSGLFDFETRLRAAIAHVLARRGPTAHIEEQHLNEKACRQGTCDGSTKFEAWKETYRACLEGAVDDDYVIHHLRVPSPELPVWATVELVSFGKLPFLFDLMLQVDQNRVARRFGVRNGRQFGKWIRALVELRNLCAHGSRVFNRRIRYAIKINPAAVIGTRLEHLASKPARADIYIYSALLAYLLTSHESGSTWPVRGLRTQVRKLARAVPMVDGKPLLSLEANMGFPQDWEQLELWR
ncbi:MAG: Abi family protein [Ancrocorticia sp.]